jgi:hypothetical protein
MNHFARLSRLSVVDARGMITIFAKSRNVHNMSMSNSWFGPFDPAANEDANLIEMFIW